MKTIITKEIDGFKIISAIGQGDGMIDPIATKAKVDKIIKETEIFKQIKKLKDSMTSYVYKEQQGLRNAKKAKTKPEQQKFMNEVNDARDEMRKIMIDLAPLGKDLQQKFSEMMLEHAVFFDLKENEKYVEDSEAEDIAQIMNEALQDGCVLSENKEKIQNNKGKIYWIKDKDEWIKSVIDVLGVEPESGEIEEKDLSPEQKEEIKEQLETERINNLDADDRLAEKNSKLESLLNQAALMKSKLEIQDDSQALQKSQDWLAVETVKIDDIYG